MKIEYPKLSVLGSNKHIAVFHHFPVAAVWIDSRPYRHNRLDTHSFKIITHRLRVGPVFGVELPVALLRPMEKVDNYCIYRYAFRFVSAGDLQYLVLAFIS